MIPFIRSLSELMAITESRDKQIAISKSNQITSSIVDSGQRKRYLKSIEKKEVNLPELPKTIKRKWLRNKEVLSKFLDSLDYNNEIQKSYELTLIARQNKGDHKDAA